jgi:hypothetical protein
LCIFPPAETRIELSLALNILLMEKIVKSPFSGGLAHLKTENVTLPYKGHQYEVVRSYYKCQDSDETFSSPEQHDLVILQLREKHRQKAIAPVLKPALAQPVAYSLQASKTGIFISSSSSNTASKSYKNWRQHSDSSMQLAD